jgi:hypothetical protein
MMFIALFVRDKNPRASPGWLHHSTLAVTH